VSKNEWDTKVGSMKNAVYVQQYGKRHLLGRSNTEQQKFKPVALVIVELHISVSQSVRQLVS